MQTSSVETSHVAGINASQSTHPRKNLNSITSLRFFATALILLLHGSEIFGFDRRVGLWDVGTWQGLTCFFVLSGFILAYVHPKLPDDLSIIKFMGARFARIWPSYMVAILLYIIAFPPSLMVPHGWWFLMADLTMTQAWFMDRACFTNFNTPCWSLSIEMFFYIVFPFLVRSLAKNWLPKLFASLCIGLGCVVLCTLQQYPEFVSFGSSSPPLLNICPISRLFEFVTGMTLGMFYLKTRDKQISKSRATMFECLALVLVALALALPKLWKLGESTQWLSALRCWIIYCGVAPAYALLTYCLAIGKGMISKLLDNSILIYLGELSFSLFLFHYSVYVFLTQRTTLLQGRAPWLGLIIWLSCTFVAAAINYEIVEKPCRKRILDALSAVLAKFSGASLRDFVMAREHRA